MKGMHLFCEVRIHTHVHGTKQKEQRSTRVMYDAVNLVILKNANIPLHYKYMYSYMIA